MKFSKIILIVVLISMVVLSMIISKTNHDIHMWNNGKCRIDGTTFETIHSNEKYNFYICQEGHVIRLHE